ncbi:MAG: transcriptional regulator [Actinobacteria bacterium]|nr:transcriptional regulator [Actinomycetota bacterium]
MKFLGYTLGDPNAPMAPPTQEEFAQMGELIEEATKAGVILATGGVGPLNDGVKVQYDGTDFTVLDGPFTEAKELIGGWALLECRDRAEAVEWTKRFLALAGPGETTIRTVLG